MRLAVSDRSSLYLFMFTWYCLCLYSTHTLVILGVGGWLSSVVRSVLLWVPLYCGKQCVTNAVSGRTSRLRVEFVWSVGSGEESVVWLSERSSVQRVGVEERTPQH